MSLRAFLTLFALTAVIVVSGIKVVHARQDNRRLFIELTRLENERDDLNVDFGRLKLEQSTWADNTRVEKVATESLGMLSPQATETRIVSR